MYVHRQLVHFNNRYFVFKLLLNVLQMSGTLFLKAGGWEFAHIHTKWNPNSAFWYSFDYRSRFTILGMDEMFPPGINCLSAMNTF